MPKNKKTRTGCFTYTCKISKQYIDKQQSYGTLKNDIFIALCRFTKLKTVNFQNNRHFNILGRRKVFKNYISNAHTKNEAFFEKKCMSYCPFSNFY